MSLALEKPKGYKRKIVAKIRLENLTERNLQFRLYLAWRHPSGIVTRMIQKDIVLKPREAIQEMDAHMPVSGGKRKLTVVAHKGEKILAQETQTIQT